LLFVMPLKRGSEVQRAVRDDAAAKAFDQNLREARRFRIAAARAAVEIDRKGHVVYEGCGSFGEFGERHGASASEAYSLLALGMALQRWPELEAQMLAGKVPEASACRMGMLTKDAAFVREDDDWVAWARGQSAKAFARRVKQRVAEVKASGAPTVEKTFYVSEKGAESFERARTLASRSAGRVLTEGEALETVSEHYLDCVDPMRRKPAQRRSPDTATLPDRRGIPAEVLRRAMARNGDRCAVPFCTNEVFLENAHRVAHCDGGCREAHNIDRICPPHHDLWHLGRLRIEGTTENPVFFTADGKPLDARTACTPPEGGPGPTPSSSPPHSPSDEPAAPP
jgi:hypothetical protein